MRICVTLYSIASWKVEEQWNNEDWYLQVDNIQFSMVIDYQFGEIGVRFVGFSFRLDVSTVV